MTTQPDGSIRPSTGEDSQETAVELPVSGKSGHATERIPIAAGDEEGGGPSARTVVPDTLRCFGRYRILNRLGHGGMGSVYLAEDTQLQRKVALKIPQLPDDDSREWLQRFYREARAAATIHHSHLCPVYDVGEIEGVHFLTMAFIEGVPLSRFSAERKQPWPVPEAVALVRKLALAIHVAHEQGIVHRDLKPANIMINRQGEPVIVDFGLARRADSEDVTLTRLGEVLGTPAYMSPEQVEGDVTQIGPASDLYSLGVILFELLTGRRPFQGSVAAVLAQLMRDVPPPPSNFRSGLDSRIDALCRRLLSRHPGDRPASATALAEALEEYLRSVTLGATLSPPLRQPARTIMPPQEDSAAYGLRTPGDTPVSATPPPQRDHRSADLDNELKERLFALLVDGQLIEAIVASRSAMENAGPGAEVSSAIRQAFVDAINQTLRTRDLKLAVRIASGLHDSALPVESADILAKTLSAAGRMLWNDNDPGPALQLWQKLVDRFPATTLLAEKGAVFAYNRGVALEQAGRFGTAIALYRQGLRFDPHNAAIGKRLVMACLHAASVEAKAGRLPAALTLCDEGLRSLPGNADLGNLANQLRNRMLHEP